MRQATVDMPFGVCCYCGVERQGKRFGVCERRTCRALFAYFASTYSMNRMGSGRWCDPFTYLYDLCTFLKFMARPKTVKQREFAKRYAHMRGASQLFGDDHGR